MVDEVDREKRIDRYVRRTENSIPKQSWGEKKEIGIKSVLGGGQNIVSGEERRAINTENEEEKGQKEKIIR